MNSSTESLQLLTPTPNTPIVPPPLRNLSQQQDLIDKDPPLDPSIPENAFDTVTPTENPTSEKSRPEVTTTPMKPEKAKTAENATQKPLTLPKSAK